MRSVESYINERLDHLGIVAGVCQEIGLANSLVLVLRLQPVHRLILTLLGPLYEKIYNPSG
ncbi:MAG TPA: hypothetical protein VIY29_21830 [Ktedonobacteraceae bacterium]